MNNLLQELRDATRLLHRELDQLVSDPGSSKASYSDYLRRFHAGLCAAWPMLDWESFESMALPAADRRKQRYHTLVDDLKQLGLQPPPLVDGSQGTGPASVGCLYVLEGSIHGGQILLARLKNVSDIPSNSLRFLEGFGDDNGSMWASFTQWLSHLEASQKFSAEAGEAAAQTFNHFISSFGQN